MSANPNFHINPKHLRIMQPVKPDTPRYERFEDAPTPTMTPILEDAEEKELEWAERLARMELRAKQESAARASDERIRKAFIQQEIEERRLKQEDKIKRNRARTA